MRALTVDEMEVVAGGRGLRQSYDSTEDPRTYFLEVSSGVQEMSKRDWCGSRGTEFVPDAPFGFDVSKACMRHDLCYGSSASRYDCDLQFLVDVFNYCRSNGGTDQACAAIATSYFLAVRGFGAPAYDGQ